ncbi:MAG: diphosphate--fructose-6-phosphate 1-phosphotransferase, partial [Simkania negevensis]|nr:diphosphate--fructose-6-phosphate 1-phosphotransferase [Simkania negevensis]
PKQLQDLKKISFKAQGTSSAVDDVEEVKGYFPNTFGQGMLHLEQKGISSAKPLKVGVVFSGGQAAGGHNVIAGLFDTLKEFHEESSLIGFLGGPGGVLAGEVKTISEDELKEYRNQGGFDLIGSGRTKIEKEKDFETALQVVGKFKLDGLVIIGGDDSNTNAAFLAEYFTEKKCKTRVIGVPKTIDGDLKNEFIELSFGFDSACRVYSEMVGNIARDALSARKYTHFIKLMGRAASHIALECALQTHPNLTLIGEEVAQKKQTLCELTYEIAHLIEKRGNQGKNFGVILFPEGLVEFIPEMNHLISELSSLLGAEEFQKASFQSLEPQAKISKIIPSLSKEAASSFSFLPKEIQLQLLLDRDPHGNVQLSHIQTELLFSELVGKELKKRKEEGSFKGSFSPVHHFFGYEGRAGFPSNFDASYCYSLGKVSALLIRDGFSGYTSCLRYLAKHPADWEGYGVPITNLMHMEMRKGKKRPVIRKALVDLQGASFKVFKRHRDQWKMEERYRFPGPLQFEEHYDPKEDLPFALTL